VSILPWSDQATMFVNGEFTHEIIRQTIASWLLFGKHNIFPMKFDAVERLIRKGQY
jgi:hypothetical protein